MSHQTEVLPALQDDEAPQADHEAVCGIGLRPKFKDGSTATSLRGQQMLDESELVDSLVNKAPRTHKAIMIAQGFNPESADHETFVEHCERAETTDDIAKAKFSASDEDSEPRQKKAPQVQGRAW